MHLHSRAAALGLILLGIASPVLAQQTQGTTGPGVPPFWVRPGYTVTLAAENFGQARFLERDPSGTVYVAQPEAGKVLAFRDENKDGVFEAKIDFLSGFRSVHGLYFNPEDGYLYFTQSGAVHRVKPADGKTPAPKDAIQTLLPEGTLPSGGGHWWRSITVKDGYLYTSIGDSGNITDEAGTERQKIWRFKLDPNGGPASDKTLFASGIRNTEKLRFRPGTNSLYGCDHGSDTFGSRYGEPNGGRNGGPITDVNPPCEFNNYVSGFNYGHPFVTGLGLPRPEYANRPNILEFVSQNTPPAWCFGAHWAPNGFTFVESPELLGSPSDAIVAFHGSWNASSRVGYRLERVCFDPATGKPYGAMPLVITLRNNGAEFLARPVDVLDMGDGTVLFSCDHTNKLYRLSRSK